MTDESTGFDRNEPEILIGETSDEALEAAGCSGPLGGRSSVCGRLQPQSGVFRT